jgi:hypothetical protein
MQKSELLSDLHVIDHVLEDLEDQGESMAKAGGQLKLAGAQHANKSANMKGATHPTVL